MKPAAKFHQMFFVFFGTISFFLISCATVRDFLQGDPKEKVFAYGYIRGDFSAPDWINIIQVSPKDQYFKYRCWTVNGVFIQGNLRQGAYQIGEFNSDFDTVDLGWSAPGFHMEKPGAYFLGSYRLVSKGLFTKEYSLVKTDTPDEETVLKKAIALVRGTQWEPVLFEKLKKLEDVK